jgi:hypothetical protein
MRNEMTLRKLLPYMNHIPINLQLSLNSNVFCLLEFDLIHEALSLSYRVIVM